MRKLSAHGGTFPRGVRPPRLGGSCGGWSLSWGRGCGGFWVRCCSSRAPTKELEKRVRVWGLRVPDGEVIAAAHQVGVGVRVGGGREVDAGVGRVVGCTIGSTIGGWWVGTILVGWRVHTI